MIHAVSKLMGESDHVFLGYRQRYYWPDGEVQIFRRYAAMAAEAREARAALASEAFASPQDRREAVWARCRDVRRRRRRTWSRRAKRR